MIGFYHQVVGGADGILYIVVRHAAVGDQYEAIAHIVDGVAKTIGRVVRDAERVDFHSEELERHGLVKIAFGCLELEGDAVVAVYTCVDVGGRINGDVQVLTQSSYRTDMVCVVVGDKYAHDVGEVEPHVSKTVVDIARGNAGIYQDALLLGAKVVAITATSRSETPKYEVLFRHN